MQPIVDTTAGKVAGFEKDGVLQFRGIPFAAPPTGARRFRPPVPVEGWDDVRDTTRYGPMAPQADGGFEAMLGSSGQETSEDCLTLNVWTPAADDANRPVMVWIHGGAFQTGSGSVPWYSGTRLVNRGDVVVVTINYRLGPLGFLHLGHLLGEDYATSGNAGLLDQVAALEWVRDNIAGFGGDPGNVTIFGESAGGMSVGTLLATPAARGLFAKAISQSGAAHNVQTKPHAELVAVTLLELLGLSAEELLDVPVETLMQVQSSLGVEAAAAKLAKEGIGMAFSPVVDGVAVPEPPIDAVRAGRAAPVPLLTGTTADEWNLFHLMARAGGAMDEARLRKQVGGALQRALGETSVDEALAVYRATRSDATPDDVWCALMTDSIFRVPALKLAEAHVAHQPATFLYFFTKASTAFGGGLGACHAIEIPFMFDNLHRNGVGMFLGDLDDSHTRLATAMSEAWLAFARTGDPSHDGIPAWPAYEPTRRATMQLGDEITVLDDPARAERRVWQGIA